MTLSPNSVVRIFQQNPGQRATRQRTSVAGERQSKRPNPHHEPPSACAPARANSFSRLRVKQVRNRRRILAAKDPDTEPTVEADWMDVPNAACELGVGPDTIRRWARESWKGANSSRARAGWGGRWLRRAQAAIAVLHVTDVVRQRVADADRPRRATPGSDRGRPRGSSQAGRRDPARGAAPRADHLIGRGHQPANIGEAGERSLAEALVQLAESLEPASDAAQEWLDSKDSEDDDAVAEARDRLLTALDESHDLAATMTRLARSLEAVAPPTPHTARTASRQSS